MPYKVHYLTGQSLSINNFQAVIPCFKKRSTVCEALKHLNKTKEKYNIRIASQGITKVADAKPCSLASLRSPTVSSSPKE